ncbi:MAG: nitroreductase [Desulfobulbaceae bacterium]|nr:nitroreductase [Desulfobulbaceae bacterium]MCK5437913.1 nitroreductase [Desulfobulbaceae bacterium]MCK5543952.1 nitroreductase [Desulfobulbaceae bacterium]
MTSPIIKAIYKRRSIREYTDDEVTLEQLREIVRAGTWAPSGLNNQPWKFVIVRDPAVREQLAQQTHYSHIIQAAPAVIAVFLDKGAMYDEVKDHQSAGACIQNMLLAVEAMGLGAVWLGQILKNKDKVNKILSLGSEYDLMAVLAIGHPSQKERESTRRDIDEFILSTF